MCFEYFFVKPLLKISIDIYLPSASDKDNYLFQ